MKKIFLAVILLLYFQTNAQKIFNPVHSPSGTITLPQNRIPSEYILYKVNKTQLLAALEEAPDHIKNQNSPVTIRIPLPDGSMEIFEMFRTHPMAPELEEQMPDNKSFRGINRKKSLRLRLDINRSGVFYAVYGLKKSTAVFQIFDNDQTYILYYQNMQTRPEEHACGVTEQIQYDENFYQRTTGMFDDGLIRKYRLAYATTGEFSQFHIQRAINNGTLSSNATDAEKKQSVLDALVVIVNRINEVYEVDAGITMEIIPNNLSIIYLDPSTDPYTNDNPSNLLTENQSNLDSVIGNSNYDIGHVASTGGGGLASLGSVCVTGRKAKGETGLANPVGDEYAIDYAAHEMGHQFGANHTFANYCNGNRNPATSVEPGSGNTIMAYAGVCAPNVQEDSDPQFHYISLYEIWNHISSHTCAATSNSNNHAPTVTTGQDKYIPKKTPFLLEATASDSDGNSLTYSWDEMDVFRDSGHTNATPNENNTSGPMFKVNVHHPENYRYFPRISNILDGSYGNDWEVLPNVSRILQFQVVVRDNVAPGGQIAHDDIALGIDATTGPFRITSTTTDEQWDIGSTHTVTWDVAGTTGGNVNCSSVDILLSANGGHTFPYVLASNTPNDGSQTITLPSSLHAYHARYMIKAHNNYFFDINRGKIRIGNYTENCNNNFTNNTAVIIPDDNPNGAISTISINDSFEISDINLTVDISHTYIQDLQIKLISPQGTEVLVWNRNCSGQDNINVTFDDEAANNINCDNMNSGGRYKPINPLSVIEGENAHGLWTLKVSDHNRQDSGILNSWKINLCKMTLVDISKNPVENLEIYPIPADDFITIRFDASTENPAITVTDMNGRHIYRSSLRETGKISRKINVKNWAKGIYIFHITDGNKSSIQKVIVK